MAFQSAFDGPRLTSIAANWLLKIARITKTDVYMIWRFGAGYSWSEKNTSLDYTAFKVFKQDLQAISIPPTDLQRFISATWTVRAHWHAPTTSAEF